MQLKDIVKIQPGTHLKPSQDIVGDAFYISLKDFDKDGNFVEEETPQVDSSEVKKRYILQENDLLFSTRGKFVAYLLPSSDKKFVASNSFVILRAEQDKVTTAYLHWYLNHPKIQKKIHALSASSHIPFLKTKMLEELEITLPSPQKQEEIATLYELHLREKRLTQRILDAKEQLVQGTLIRSINP